MASIPSNFFIINPRTGSMIHKFGERLKKLRDKNSIRNDEGLPNANVLQFHTVCSIELYGAKDAILNSKILPSAVPVDVSTLDDLFSEELIC
jgi:hypothetical protein